MAAGVTQSCFGAAGIPDKFAELCLRWVIPGHRARGGTGTKWDPEPAGLCSDQRPLAQSVSLYLGPKIHCKVQGAQQGGDSPQPSQPSTAWKRSGHTASRLPNLSVSSCWLEPAQPGLPPPPREGAKGDREEVGWPHQVAAIYSLTLMIQPLFQ